ncbi:MAG: uracil-DNA glycosylase [Candidatus Sericytochromatia bacterium]|nr:uracil-DNA glycosylase [Candidatus Sericytochromatia bacterium]
MTEPALPPVEPRLDESWKRVLAAEFQQPYFRALKAFLLAERAAGRTFYPPGRLIFNALDRTPFEAVRVVLLGQDPYHGPGQAEGMCFSVPRGVAIPPSLQNIFKELQADLGLANPGHGHLGAWAAQGVLLLNATLTVRAHQAASHHGQGWETFTDAIIRELNVRREGLVFVLWGRHAQQKGRLVDATRHLVLKAAHPSPLSATNGFFGCRHFSAINRWLVARGQAPIDWRLT